MKKLILAMLLLNSWTAFAQSSTIKHCIPLNESIRLHEDAVRSKYFIDSLMQESEGSVIKLENKIADLTADYENLLKNSNLKSEELNKIIAANKNLLDNAEQQKKYYKKKTLWANFKLYTALTFAAIMTYIAVKE